MAFFVVYEPVKACLHCLEQDAVGEPELSGFAPVAFRALGGKAYAFAEGVDGFCCVLSSSSKSDSG